jgi:hypothetical protein
MSPRLATRIGAPLVLVHFYLSTLGRAWWPMSMIAGVIGMAFILYPSMRAGGDVIGPVRPVTYWSITGLVLVTLVLGTLGIDRLR